MDDDVIRKLANGPESVPTILAQMVLGERAIVEAQRKQIDAYKRMLDKAMTLLRGYEKMVPKAED